MHAHVHLPFGLFLCCPYPTIMPECFELKRTHRVPLHYFAALQLLVPYGSLLKAKDLQADVLWVEMHLSGNGPRAVPAAERAVATDAAPQGD